MEYIENGEEGRKNERLKCYLLDSSVCIADRRQRAS